jgi:hypothetical protein
MSDNARNFELNLGLTPFWETNGLFVQSSDFRWVVFEVLPGYPNINQSFN